MKSTTHDRFIVAAIIVIMAARLWILPARAQCDTACSQVPEPEIGLACTDLHPWSCDANQLYLPAVSR